MKQIFTSILLLFSLISFAQIDTSTQWTWMNGDKTVNGFGVYGTQGTAAPTNKPGARGFSISWRDAPGNMWLFGGNGFNGLLNDLWKYNPITNLWTWVSGDNTGNSVSVYGTQGTASPTNKPGGRYGSISWTDSSSGNLWLFGGTVNAAGGTIAYLNDLWKYDPLTNLWTWVSGDSTVNSTGVYGTQGTAASTNKPSARYYAASWRDTSGNFWLFGGNGFAERGSGSLNDLWKYNPKVNQWTWVNGDNTNGNFGMYGTQGTPASTNKPGGRDRSVSWTDASGRLWLFGGKAGLKLVLAF